MTIIIYGGKFHENSGQNFLDPSRFHSNVCFLKAHVLKLILVLISNFLSSRLEIISDVVSEKARSGKIPIPHRKYRYHIGFFPIPCGIGIFPLRAFPIPHRKLFLTCQWLPRNSLVKWDSFSYFLNSQLYILLLSCSYFLIGSTDFLK